jgi:hypothetical protein
MIRSERCGEKDATRGNKLARCRYRAERLRFIARNGIRWNHSLDLAAENTCYAVIGRRDSRERRHQACDEDIKLNANIFMEIDGITWNRLESYGSSLLILVFRRHEREGTDMQSGQSHRGLEQCLPSSEKGGNDTDMCV